jgi:WD40 repeat protein
VSSAWLGPRGVSAAGFSPDGRLLASGGGTTVALWDMTDAAFPAWRGAVTHRRGRRWTGPVSAAGFSPDGRLLVTGAADGRDTAILWDITGSGAPARLAAIRAQRDAPAAASTVPPTVKAAGFSPDGRLLATGSGHTASTQFGSTSSGAVVLWDVTDPAHPAHCTLLPRARNAGEVHALAFSPDSRLLACDEGAKVSVWDITGPAHPQSAATFTGHRGAVAAMAFSPGGKLLASSGTDIRLWEMGTGRDC